MSFGTESSREFVGNLVLHGSEHCSCHDPMPKDEKGYTAMHYARKRAIKEQLKARKLHRLLCNAVIDA
eukprot:5622455-Amphidinium_carterae.1